MTISSRSALADGLQRPRTGLLVAAALAMSCLGGCVTPPEPPRATPSSNDPRALEADLNARLDALQHQPQPVSDDVMASLERALREQREKRARASAAGMPAVAAEAPAAAPTMARPVVEPPPVVAAATPAKPVRTTKSPARAASAVADAVAPPSVRAPDPVPATMAAATTASTLAGPARTPMSRTAESHTPVDELYARAREFELQSQVAPAIALYREASQRGHAPSSQRLMELYADGAPGVARDYRVAVFFKERAVQQGASFDVWRR